MMAKAMKIPVLIFEHVQECEWLIDGLEKVLKETEVLYLKNSIQYQDQSHLKEQLNQIQEIMKKVNINK